MAGSTLSDEKEEKKKEMYRVVEIWDAEGHYIARLNISESIQHNRPMSSQLTINSRYPYHIHNGAPFYYSGQCAATFVDNEEDEDEEEEDECEEETVDVDDYTNKEGEVADFNYEFAEWLHNGLVKSLKYSENKILYVGILETVEITTEQDSTIDDKYNSKVVFHWEEISDGQI